MIPTSACTLERNHKSEERGKASPKISTNQHQRIHPNEQFRRKDAMGCEADMTPVFGKSMKMHFQLKKVRLGEEASYAMGMMGILQNFESHLFLLWT